MSCFSPSIQGVATCGCRLGNTVGEKSSQTNTEHEVLAGSLSDQHGLSHSPIYQHQSYSRYWRHLLDVILELEYVQHEPYQNDDIR